MEQSENREASSVRSTAPAEGERRAICGYYPQYRVSAYLILRALRDGNLQWIRVADPEASRVDDLQIGTHVRVDAFQIKWSQYGGSFTFNELVSSSGSVPCLIAQLAEGWQKLRNAYPKHRVVVHLITNATPSTSASALIPVGDKPPTPKHFAAFLEQVWKPKQHSIEDSNHTVPESWRPAWNALCETSGLSPANFDNFVRDCELEFGWGLPYSGGATTLDQEIVQHDVEHLTETLFATVADPSRVIELDRAQLLSRLGWTERFEFKSHHDFPVDEVIYEPIEVTVHQLENALGSLPNGYIALLGTPGSGKSTLLTQTFRLRPERVIRYYAYVPDAQDPVTLRGESVNFLHDVVLALEEQGFRVGDSPSQFDHNQLLERLYKQIQLLHKDWQVNGHKTVIIIDGLDHIEREQHPSRSLLGDLPPPEQVPNGIYFILGTQTDAHLPDRVQATVRKPERRIEMAPLTREAVIRITERIKLPVVTPEQKEMIYVLSNGHPLALAYILNYLHNVTDEENLEAALQGIERYEGSIENQYHSYWRQIEKDAELVHLLGLLARMRGVIDLLWVETWADQAVVSQLRHTLYQYFRREDGNRWYFFHNSFRLELVQKTAESMPGVFDVTIDHRFHHELAEICAKAPSNSFWSWEELYHRVLAEEHEVVLTLASQEWFHRQFLAFRPIDAIQADIRLALKSVADCQDPVALARLMLVGAEIAQRGFYLESTLLIQLLLHIGEKQIAAEHIRDGNRLRTDAIGALRLSRQLKGAGMVEESRRVFELAEPLDLLTGPTPIEDDPQDEKGTLLEEWAKVAVHFRDLDRIIKTIHQVRKGADRYKREDVEKATELLQNRMLFHTGLELLNLEKWEDLSKISNAFKLDDEDALDWWFWLHVNASKYCAGRGDKKRAQLFLKEVLDKVKTRALDPEAQVALVEGLYRILDRKEACERFQNIPQPRLQTDVYYSAAGLQPFLQRFRYTRLLYAFGSQQSPSDLVPEPDEPRHIGIVYLERALCIIARIWAEAWRSQRMDSHTIMQEISPLLHLFNRNWQETRDWTSWHVVQSSRGEFYKLLVDAVAQHGSKAVQALRTAFEKEWDNQKIGLFWPIGVRREIILALHRAGADRDWSLQKIKALQDVMLNDNDVSGRVEECSKQAEAWLALGEKQSARQTLEQMLQVSFGVGYRKDYQLNTWIEWLGRINQAEPQRAADRISWFARAITALKEETEGRTSKSVANKLLEIAFDWSPRRAIFLFYWFLNQGIIWHEEAVRVLLHKALESGKSSTELALRSIVDFLLPIATTADRELAALVIGQIASSHGNKRALEQASYFLSKVNAYALPSTRAEWRYGIVQAVRKLGFDLKDVGLEPKDIQIDSERDGTISTLRLGDRSTLTIDEIEATIHSVSDLQKLVARESRESYFNWEPIITNLIQNVNEEDIYSIVGLFQSKHHAAQIIAALSERLCELGNLNAAWSLGMEALNASKAYGWNRWSDGGSRLAAFRALNRIDSIQARPLAYETLVRDLTTEFRHPQEIVLNLSEILSLLTDDLPLGDIWTEIEKYVERMFEGSSLPTDEPIELESVPSQDTPSRANADLLIFHTNHPVSLVAQAAQRACANLLLQSDTNIQHAVHEFLGKNESYQESILIVLEAVGSRESRVVEPFQEIFANLILSPNYAVRNAARIISSRIGIELTQSSRSVTSLPPIYRLSLPPHPALSITGWKGISEGEPLPDSDDPLLIVSPFDLQIESIAEEIGLPKVNMCYRAVQIMRQLDPQSTWSAEGEKKLRANLDSIGLRLPYRRPRTMLARRSMYHIVTELIEAEVLHPENLRSLERVLRFYDPTLVLVEPVPRPLCIHPIAMAGQQGRSNEEWLEHVNEALGSMIFQTEENVILAENTKLKHLEWETPIEIRQSLMLPSSTLRPPDPSQLWQRVTNRIVSEYPSLQVDGIPAPLTIQNVAYGFDSPGSNWLALNPLVGLQFTWHLSDNGLFRWVDIEGQTMVETLWWRDGSVEQSPPNFHNEVGEGWLVVASKPAWKAIKSQWGTLKRVLRVERSCYHNGQKVQNEAYSEQIVS